MITENTKSKTKEDYIILSDNIILHDEFMDIMRNCLYSAEKHAIVIGQMIDNNRKLIDAAREHLPEYTVTNQVHSDCVLIKQSIIDMFGYPDDSCNNLLKAISDYYEKINRYGYSAVIAHKALYSLTESQESLFESGLPKIYENLPLFQLLPVLVENYYPKKRILFDCFGLPPYYCGTTEVMLSSFEAFTQLFGDKYDIFIYTNIEASKYHNLNDKYDNILYPDTIYGSFHLGYSPVQMCYFDSQAVLNKHCLKIVQQVLDIIMLRALCEGENPAAIDYIALGSQICDGITFISNTGKEDFYAFYADENLLKEDKKKKVIYIAKESCEDAGKKYEIPYDEYFLITGNNYTHKAIKETIESITNTKNNYVVIGTENTEYISDNIYGYKNAHLDDGLINYLYANCIAVIFPSLYEGFGLPVIMGLQNGKRVIVNNNKINNELLNHFTDIKDFLLFFDSFKQIPEIIDKTNFTIKLQQTAYGDSWDRAAAELESFFSEILSEKVDVNNLLKRQKIYKYIESRATDVLVWPSMVIDDLRIQYEKQYNISYEKDKHISELIDDLDKTKSELYSIKKQFGEYKLSELLRFAIKENIKNRHSGLFRKLKK